MKNLITIIIPFLNEGEEVELTVKSIVENSSEDIEIILINDASTDNYNYDFSNYYKNIKYIVNENRLGVAACRDLGISISTTPFFLLLDAHMRFYDKHWEKRIIEELSRDNRTLLCCQTKILEKENGVVKEVTKMPESLGACIDLYYFEGLFEPIWLFTETEATKMCNTIPIPCVLGAGYACSKSYWQYLKGLSGLLYYGNDEAFICMKVWLEGGTCQLLKDVKLGHIYRNTPPYRTTNEYRIYNKLLIAKLLIPENKRKKIISQLKRSSRIYSKAYLMFYRNRKEIDKLSKYYNSIKTKDFSYFERMNNQLSSFKDIDINPEETLEIIAMRSVVESKSTDNIGLLYGKMGILLFLYHYSKEINSKTYAKLAEYILDVTCEDILRCNTIDFANGLAGIGWSIEYLSQNGFIEGDTNDILKDFDCKIMEVNPLRVSNLNLEYGLGGIVHYVMSRLYTYETLKGDKPFDDEYLTDLYRRIKLIIDNEETDNDSIDVFIKFKKYYENEAAIEKPSVYDVVSLIWPLTEYIPQKFGIHLKGGNAGIGLKLMFEKNEIKSMVPA